MMRKSKTVNTLSKTKATRSKNNKVKKEKSEENVSDKKKTDLRLEQLT